MDIYVILSLLFLKAVTMRTMILCFLYSQVCGVFVCLFLNNTMRISLGKYPYRCRDLHMRTKIKQADIGNMNKTPCHRVSWE